MTPTTAPSDPPYHHVMVTGGCGFIGSNLVRQLLTRYPDLRLTNLDALTYAGVQANLDDVAHHPGYRLVRARVEDARAVRQAMQGVDAVLHLAAETHVDRAILGPQVFVTTNVLGTQVLLDAARECGVQRFLQVGTDEVYGPAAEAQRFDEQATLAPRNPYAASKAAGDLLALSHGVTYGLDVVVTRCCNNYGPHQLPEKLIPLVITNARRDQPVPVYGDGEQQRDWIHVLDHCEALLAVLAQGRSGEIYNIATETEHPNLQLVHRLLELLDKPLELVRHVEDRRGHDRRYALSSRKLRAQTGWAPQRDLERGLAETVAWYGAHQRWVDAVRNSDYEAYYRRQYGARLASTEEEP